MHLDLIREKARAFPGIANPEGYRSARIWHCGYQSLRGLSRFVNLRKLEIATYPDTTLEPLASLVELEELRIVHLPRVTSLTPLQSLRRLRSLCLATLPSWDASGKVTIVESLAPLRELPALEHVELHGVVPESKSVEDLLRCQSLKKVRISKYPKREQERINARVPA